MLERFHFCIRPAAIFAGVIGCLQSLLWMALCVTGIVAYYCNFNLEDKPNALGSLLELTFFKVYFNGPCDQTLPQNVDFSSLEGLEVLQPPSVHGVIWAYLMLSFFWLISSVTLLTSVKFKYIRFTNIFLFIWIAITAIISILDLAFGILFGLDYGVFMQASYEVELTVENVVQTAHAVLLAAQASAGIMMGVAFRGFLLWLINVALVGYFFTKTLEITDYNRSVATGVDNFGYRGDKNTDPYGFSNRNHTPAPLWLNQPEAAARSSTLPYPSIPHVETRNHRPPPPAPPMMNTATMDRRREDDVVMRNTNNLVREINDRNSLNATRRNEPNPDYSPPMPRTNNPYDRQRSMMRASRF